MSEKSYGITERAYFNLSTLLLEGKSNPQKSFKRGSLSPPPICTPLLAFTVHILDWPMSGCEEMSVSTGMRIEEELESKLLSTGFEGKWVGKNCYQPAPAQ